VRGHVAKTVGAQYLIPMAAMLEKPEDLRFSALPNSFILKATHSSGMNLIVPDKKSALLEEMRAMVRQWQATDFASRKLERHYADIPRRVIVEELLLDEKGEVPDDYRFYVFHRKVAMIRVDAGSGDAFTMTFFTREWRELNVLMVNRKKGGDTPYPRETESIARPDNLEEMVAVAEKLAEPFSMVRIDLYRHKGRIYFGEMTHTPGAAEGRFDPPEFDRVLGDIWRKGGEIPAKYYLNGGLSRSVEQEDIAAIHPTLRPA